MSPDRTYVRTLAQQYQAAGQPLAWFEALYASAKAGDATVPWAELQPNPNLVAWLESNKISGAGRTALTVGCGVGDDVEELQRRGFRVVGFDISPTAIAWCRDRFPHSAAQYVVGDVLKPPPDWHQAFDFVLEAYTLQALPDSLRSQALQQIADCVAPGGQLLVISRGRDTTDPPGQLPYPLLKSEVLQFVEAGLSLVSFEDYWDQESPPIRRFRATFQRPISPVS